MDTQHQAYQKVFTVVIGGAAGDGVREAGTNLSRLLAKMGYEVFNSVDYPSLIRGGHNFSRVTFSQEKITSDYEGVDVLIALNGETLKKHKDELLPGAVIIAEAFDDEDRRVFGEGALEIKMMQMARELGAPAITRSSVALGAVCYLLDLPFETMVEDLKRVFAEKSLEANITLAEKGYEILKNQNYRHSKSIRPHQAASQMELWDGNAACGYGMVKAGLNFYVSYPMTPASSLLHYLAKYQRDFNIRVVQPENEIAAINMIIGMSYAGKRAATGTSGGGFALMEEAFSLAGMAETPIVVVLSQRMAPATGVPTYTSQADLRFAIHAGHGDFPRLVIAPGDAQEAFQAGADAMNLSWKHQLPAIVLLDKHLSESQASLAILEGSVAPGPVKMYEGDPSQFLRYKLTDDGVSPMLFPGVPGATVRATSYEHDEEGLAVEEKEPIIANHQKRVAKGEGLKKDSMQYETIKVYGDANALDAIIFWGSTKGAILEASKYFVKPVRLVQVVWLEPLDSGRIYSALDGVTRLIDVENNGNAQLAGLLRGKTGLVAQHALLRYDGRPFDPLQLADKINQLIA